MQITAEIDKKTRLNSRTLSLMKDNNTLKARLCAEFDKSYDTIQRWINTNDVMLTTIDALKIIYDELGIEMNKALEFYK